MKRAARSPAILILMLAILIPAPTPERGPDVSAGADSQIRETTRRLGKVPVSFEVNRGQADPEVQFLFRGSRYVLFLTSTEAVARFAAAPDSGAESSIRLRPVGARRVLDIRGEEKLPARSHYFVGRDPRLWRTGIEHFARVRYREVYPGIDLVYHGDWGELEYDFIVSPGADPRMIALAFERAEKIELDSKGDIVVKIPGGELRQRRPRVYQEASGETTEISGCYRLRGPNEFVVEVGAYDATLPLVIDPVLAYSTYLGSTGGEAAHAMAVDAAGNAYITGYTSSAAFPTSNALQSKYGGGSCFLSIIPCGDVFVSKLSPDGSRLLYSTFLGGGGDDIGGAIALDSSGHAFVVGSTQSSDFPTTPGAIQNASKGGREAFLAKLDASGSSLLYSTYIGGSGSDSASGVSVDPSGSAFLTGSTSSSDFPTASAYQSKFAGNTDAFVLRLDPAASALEYSTYLGGSGSDSGNGISVDSSGRAHIVGNTSSTDFHTAGAFQSSNAGATDAFVAALALSGSELVYSTYLGGSRSDSGLAIALDEAGNFYVTGGTGSADFPTVNPLDATYGGGTCGAPEFSFPCRDAFLTKLRAGGSGVEFSTYLGGSGPNSDDEGKALVVDPSGHVYVTGSTASSNFPVLNALQSVLGGALSEDAFVTKFAPSGSRLVSSTYLGGQGREIGYGIGLDGAGNIYVAGSTYSSNLPVVKPIFGVYGGVGDVFVSKIDPSPRIILDIQMSQSGYFIGQPVTAVEFRLKNETERAEPVELKVWLTLPETKPISFLNLGADGSFVLPAGFDRNLGPITLFVADLTSPRGTYEFSSRLVDPVTGKLIDEDLTAFRIPP